MEQDKNPILNKPLSWYDESGHEYDNYSVSFVSEHLSISCTESVVNFTSSGIPFGIPFWDSEIGKLESQSACLLVGTEEHKMTMSAARCLP